MLRRNHVLIVLMLIYAFNNVDGVAWGIVMEDVKKDLSLTDTQLGFLTGMAFAVFYALMGIPIARWADRGNRVTIIALTTATWSVALAVCAAAMSFVQLLLARVVVAIGESGCHPPAHSLIADYFSRAERPRAVARYMLGLPLALTIGYFSAGWLNQLYGWRTTFVVIGLPGLVLAAVALLTLNEPRRTGAAVAAAPKEEREWALRDVVVTLCSTSTFRNLLLCFSAWYFFGCGLMQWQPTFFIRSHGFETGELGVWLAVVHGGGAFIGIWFGGEWSARYARNDERRQLAAVAFVFSIFGIFNAAAYLVSSHTLAFALLAVGSLGGNMAQGPMFATIQTVVPARMRAIALALIYMFANLIGLGLGPLAVGAISDGLRSVAGEESLRYALLIFSPGYLWVAWHAWRASRTVVRDLHATRMQEVAGAAGDGPFAVAKS